MAQKVDVEGIRDAIRRKYGEVAVSADDKFNYPTGRKGALFLGYDPGIVAGMPDGLVESFCGVGNPFSLGPVTQGESLLDVGCGAGFDLFVASRLVGPEGRVYGIDITPEMVEKADKNMKRCDVTNSHVHVAKAESLPYDDGSFDIIISNGVLNLSPLKEKSFRELYRVLKPGGRLQFADIFLEEDAPGASTRSLESWSN
jgi:arsenite methyltransferase